jgi:hypothetical protein
MATCLSLEVRQCVVLLETLRNYPENERSVQEACVVLKRMMSHSPTVQQCVGTEDGLRILVGALVRQQSNYASVIAICSVLWKLLRHAETPAMKASFACIDGPEKVLLTLYAHIESGQTMQVVGRILNHVTRPDHNDHPLTQQNIQRQMHSLTVPYVVRLLKNYPDYVDVAKYVCILTGNLLPHGLSGISTTRKIFVGGMLDFVRHHIPSDFVQVDIPCVEYALYALDQVISDSNCVPEFKEAVLLNNGCETLLGVLKKYPDHANTTRYILNMLSKVVEGHVCTSTKGRHDPSTAKIAGNRGIGVLLTVLEIYHDCDARIVKQAIELMSALMHCSVAANSVTAGEWMETAGASSDSVRLTNFGHGVKTLLMLVTPTNEGCSNEGCSNEGCSNEGCYIPWSDPFIVAAVCFILTKICDPGVRFDITSDLANFACTEVFPRLKSNYEQSPAVLDSVSVCWELFKPFRSTHTHTYKR